MVDNRLQRAPTEYILPLSYGGYMPRDSAKLTLIVVDDDLDIRRAVGRSLRSHGHEVYLFESGEECLAQDRDADCAIVDIGLPGVNGLEMEEQLRKRGRAIPVVFITAHDDLATRACLRTPMPVLRKPLEEGDLLAAIEQATASSL
jgi:FixJ family two-component response regulator